MRKKGKTATGKRENRINGRVPPGPATQEELKHRAERVLAELKNQVGYYPLEDELWHYFVGVQCELKALGHLASHMAEVNDGGYVITDSEKARVDVIEVFHHFRFRLPDIAEHIEKTMGAAIDAWCDLASTLLIKKAFGVRACEGAAAFLREWEPLVQKGAADLRRLNSKQREPILPPRLFPGMSLEEAKEMEAQREELRRSGLLKR